MPSPPNWHDACLLENCHDQARSLLNKICPDNLAKIVDQLANIKLHNAEELKHVIQIIFKKAGGHALQASAARISWQALAEPHYCDRAK